MLSFFHEYWENRLRLVDISVTSPPPSLLHIISVLVYTHHLLRTPVVNRHIDCPSKLENFIDVQSVE